MSLVVTLRPHLQLLSLLLINVLLCLYYSHHHSQASQELEKPVRRRLPDVLIMGVKKCGTITLGWGQSAMIII